MNVDKLAKQLRRDVAAHPKKAVALGLMVAVALYCWGPLVWGWMNSGRAKQADQVQLANLILTDDPLEPADKAKSRSKAKFRWEKVRPLLAKDPRMVSAGFEEVWIDPFGKPEIATEEGGDLGNPGRATSAATSEAVERNPADMGLNLTSVAISPRRRAATIGGERYYVGDEITSTNKDGSLQAAKFRVAKITPQGVELECKGRTFVLRLEKSRLANGDQIERKPNEHDPRD